jgi:hypothetical protein
MRAQRGMDRPARPLAILALLVTTFVCALATGQDASREAVSTPIEPAPAEANIPALPPAPPTTSAAAPAAEPEAYPPAASSSPSYAPVYPPPGRRERHYDGPPLLLGRKISVGGYGGVGTAYTHMLNRHGALVSFEGALLLAHRLSLGLTGFGFSRTPDGPLAADGTQRNFGAGYGGFVARYAFLTQFPVYFSAGLMVGGGAVVLHRDDVDDADDDEWDDDDAQSDGFFVAQPELSMHANLTRWMRLGVTAGYRVTSKVDRFALDTSDLNGVVLGGNIQFGWI